MSEAPQSIFLLGTGYIGGSLLLEVVKSFTPQPKITVLIRKDEYIPTLQGMGVDYIKGSLDSRDLLIKTVLENQVVIHAATADDEPSVEAVLEGIKQRAAKGQMTTYLHTSGTGELQDHTNHFKDLGVIYSDEEPSKIDALPDSADHRVVDLKILKVKKELGDKAKISIIMPPCIWGIGTSPFNKHSQQVVAHEKVALKSGVVPCVGDGAHYWSYIHIKDLVPGYVTILKHMLATPASDPDFNNPYYFCESFEQSWKKTSEIIKELLPGLNTSRATAGNGLFSVAQLSAMSAESRSRAVRLRKLGWKPNWNQEDFKPEIERELEMFRKAGEESNSRAYTTSDL